MNIPEIYLTEPYNAYASKKKKHWHEVVEEQALMAKILAEANRNSTLAPDMPNQATPEIQAIPPAGGGGMPRPQFFNPSMTIGYTQSTLTASAPVLVQFTNTGDSLLYVLDTIYLQWDFGDGTKAIGPNPVHLYTKTGSNFAVTMSAVAKVDSSDTTTANSLIQVNAPTVTAAFIPTGRTITKTGSYYSASANDVLTFVNGTTTNNTANVITYKWLFGSGSAPTFYGTSTLTSPIYTFGSSGEFNVVLGATGSFNIMSAGIRLIHIESPQITASITAPVWADVTTSGSAPFAVEFTGSATSNWLAVPQSYLWNFGSGSLTSTNTMQKVTYATAGLYTATFTAYGANNTTGSTKVLILVS